MNLETIMTSFGYKGCQTFLRQGRDWGRGWRWGGEVKIEIEVIDLFIQECSNLPYEFFYKQNIIS